MWRPSIDTRMFVALCFLFVFLCGLFILFSLSDTPNEPVVTLTEWRDITAETDSDGDGVPDWLEEVSETDASEASSFPYRKDIALAKNISADELLYGGPGEFTEEVVRKILLEGEDVSSLSEEKREQFVDASVDYFLKQVERRGFPAVELRINNAVPREETLKAFLLSLKKISDEQQSIDTLVYEIFAKNTSILPEAERMRLACNYTLKHIPREVPSEIYDPYYLVLERFVYSCEALSVALTSDRAESFFYALRLLGSGALFEEVTVISEEELQKTFIAAAREVIDFLRTY